MKNNLLSLCLLVLVSVTAPSAAQEPEPCDSCAGYPAGSYMRSGGPELGGAVYHLSCQSGTWEDLNGSSCVFADCTLDGETVVHGASYTFYSAEEDADCVSISQSRTCTDGTLDGSASFQYASCSAPPSGPTNCDTIGQQCDDDSFYIGLSPADGERVYMTAAAHETSIRWDEDPPCYRCGLGDTGATSITDGRANVEALRAYSGDNATAGNLDGFGAAKYCDGLNAIEAHGYDDWYLPAGGTGTGTEQNLFWAMVQAEGVIDGIGSTSSYYWSSSENTSASARIQRFSDGLQFNYGAKNFTYRVRCVRR